MTFKIVLCLLFFLFGPRISRSQVSLATCKGDGYAWLYNSKNQSPCDMAATLMAVCHGSNFTIYPLPSNHTYVRHYEEPCSCGTITWTLFAACATCQNEAPISWSLWSYNCSNVHVSSFPYDIPPETAIPGWAYLRVGTDDMWNTTAARQDLGGPESTATSPPSSTFSGTSVTTGGSNGGSNNPPNMTGPIVGGVVGGVVVFVMLVVGIVIARRRYLASRRPPSTLHGPQGTSPYRTMPVPNSPTSPGYSTEYSMRQKLNDPSDPVTYPCPLSYEPSTYIWMPDSPPYGRQTYQRSGEVLSPNRYTDVQ